MKKTWHKTVQTMLLLQFASKKKKRKEKPSGRKKNESRGNLKSSCERKKKGSEGKKSPNSTGSIVRLKKRDLSLILI